MKNKWHIYDYLPYLVFILTVGISILIYNHMTLQLNNDIRKSVSKEADNLILTIQDRMGTYEQVLRGISALVKANDYVLSRDEWLEYAHGLHVNDKYPGIQGISFAKKLAPEEVAEHVRMMRQNGVPDYKIWPEGKRAEYVVVDMIYPEGRLNKKVIGYDLFSEKARRDMLLSAEKTGSTSLSKHLVLVQYEGASNDAGVLMGMPVYKNGKLTGYVTAPFRIKDLMHGVIKKNENDVSLKIYDTSTSDKNLMYSSGHPDGSGKKFVRRCRINLYGTSWVIETSPREGYFRQFDMNKPLLILFIGIIIGVLLSVLILIMLKTRAKAYEIAERMAQRYASSENRYRVTFEQAGVGIIMVSMDLKIFRHNKRFCEIAGLSPKELKHKNYLDIVKISEPLDSTKMLAKINAGSGSYETEREIIRNDGSRCVANVTVSVMKDHNGGPLYFIMIVEDITRRKMAEDAIVALSLRQSAILDNSLVGIVQIKKLEIEWVN